MKYSSRTSKWWFVALVVIGALGAFSKLQG